MLAGCGVAGVTSPSTTSASVDGLVSPSGTFHVHLAPVDDLAPTKLHASEADRRWRDLQTCAHVHVEVAGIEMNLHGGVAIGGGQLAFFYDGQPVGGYFIQPRDIDVVGQIEDYEDWKHEMRHLLLLVLTGDSGHDHHSPWFNNCVPFDNGTGYQG
jgi:hypothetical protein